MALKKVDREILALSLPAIASNITVPLLGLVDVAIVGHIGSAVYIAAISLGGTAINMLYWIFSFLRLGSSGLTAQAFGSGDRDAQRAVFYRGLFISFILSGIILSLQGIVGGKVIEYMGAGDEASLFARTYFSVCIWGAPAVIGSCAVSGWMLGMQYSRGPMWVALITNVINIPLSLIFVFVLHYDIRGVALGTAIAQWTGFIAGLIIVSVKFHPGFPRWKTVWDASGMKRFFVVNADIFLRTICLVAVTLWFTHAGAKQGTLILAANALMMQFFMLFSYFMDGFAFAGEAMAGKYLGARDFSALRKSVERLFVAGGAVAALFTLLYLLAGDDLMRLLTSDGEAIKTGRRYFLWVLAIPASGFMAFIWDGIFGGMTHTKKGLLIPMIISVGVFFGIYAMLSPRWGNNGLWAAFLAYCLTRGLVQTAYYFILRKKLR